MINADSVRRITTSPLMGEKFLVEVCSSEEEELLSKDERFHPVFLTGGSDEVDLFAEALAGSDLYGRVFEVRWEVSEGTEALMTAITAASTQQ